MTLCRVLGCLFELSGAAECSTSVRAPDRKRILPTKTTDKGEKQRALKI